jgi:4-hydroxy-tetrahydrodipicolinate reductase
MGRAIVRLAESAELAVVCAVGVAEVGRDVGQVAGVGALGVPIVDDPAALDAAGADVVVDFSVPAVTSALVARVEALGVPLVSGTTGLDPEAHLALDRAAESTAVLWEPNMSIGVFVQAELVSRAAATLADWDIEVVEIHHRRKTDAPSGTALRLAEVAKHARQGDAEIVHGRHGNVGARGAGEIGMHAVRGGDVPGDHTVFLFGAGERIEITHRAATRDIFAQGALRAARWIVGRPPGRYRLRDVLGSA